MQRHSAAASIGLSGPLRLRSLQQTTTATTPLNSFRARFAVAILVSSLERRQADRWTAAARLQPRCRNVSIENTATGIAAPNCCPARFYSSSAPAAVSAEQLTAALAVLRLPSNCSDADVKKAFQAYAKKYHPDMHQGNTAASHSAVSPGSKTSSGSSSCNKADDSACAMQSGTDAYQLLRRTSFEDRQRLLQRGSGSRRFQGPSCPFQYTTEEYCRAQKAYQGHPNSRSAASLHADAASSGRRTPTTAATPETRTDFDERTTEGRRRTARFNEYQERVEWMRRQGLRDDLPPWRTQETARHRASDKLQQQRSPQSARHLHGGARRVWGTTADYFNNFVSPHRAGRDGSSARADPGSSCSSRSHVVTRVAAAILDWIRGKPPLLYCLLTAPLMTAVAAVLSSHH